MIDGKECIFCGNTRLLELKSLGFSTTDAILYEDNDFIISPDFVGVVLGHLLIISKAHLHSFGEATHNQWNELLKLESKCKDLLNCDDLLIFEHGAVIEDRGGASINHAHIHVMPRPSIVTETYIDDFICKSGFIEGKKILATPDLLQNCYKRSQPYIYYSIDQNGYFYEVGELPHQFLRMMFQPMMDISYDWRQSHKTLQAKIRFMDTISFVKNNMWSMG